MEMPTLRTEVKSLLLVAFWAIFGAGLFDRFPLPGLVCKLYLIALALLVTVAAFGFGSLLVKFCRAAELSPAEFFVFSTIAGFGLLSLAMAAAGVVSLWT